MSTVISVFCLAFGIGVFIDIGHNEAIYQRQVTMHRYIALSTRNTTIEGTLSRSMGQSELGCRYALTDIRVDSGSVLSDKMGILLDIPCNQKLILQDRVSLRGKLEEIPVLKGFDYRSYLLLSGIYAQVRSDMLVVIRHGGASFATFIATIRQTFLEAIERVFP
jgi:hypothetical protein